MAEDYISKGTTIRELEKLRKKSSCVSEGRLHWKKDDELIELEKEYKILRKQRQDLVKKAKDASILKEIQKYVEQQAEGDELDISSGKFANENTLFKALELTMQKKVMETYNAYRLTGITFVLLDENYLRFCLDTFYKGQYFEPYYMEICIKDENIKIVKHTIPFFIPLKETLQKCKGSEGVKEFVSVISTYLNAFVARRQQFLQAQQANEHYVIKDFYSTRAFDFIKFLLKLPDTETQDIIVKIKYTELKQKLPQEVDLVTSDRGNEMLENLKKNLLSIEVKEAIISANY